MKNLTENQNQIISSLVAEFTRINEVKVSSGNPFADLLAEANEDKRQYEELLAIDKAKTLQLEEQIISNFYDLSVHFKELGIDCEVSSNDWINLKLKTNRSKVLNIYARVSSDIKRIGSYSVHINHKILYFFSNITESWLCLDEMFNSERFKNDFKAFIKALNE